MSDAVPEDPMTIETARMFYERALKAEAEVKRLRGYIDQMPYPDEYEAEEARLKTLWEECEQDNKQLEAEVGKLRRDNDLLREALRNG